LGSDIAKAIVDSIAMRRPRFTASGIIQVCRRFLGNALVEAVGKRRESV
jgi:hypothetical protein